MSTACFAIVPTRGRGARPGKPRGIVTARSLTEVHAPPEHPELDEREQQDDQREDECERCAEPELSLLEGGLEDEQRHGPRRVERAAKTVREDIDRVERAEHTDRRHSEDEDGGRREKRKWDR